MSEYQRIRLDVDVHGRPQNVDQKVARITIMFQTGLVREDIARAVIRQISHGEDVAEIETTRLQVKPLDSVMMDTEIRKEREAADAERLKAQGLTPRERPTI